MARILVVDDESDILALNKRRFEAQGYPSSTAPQTPKRQKALRGAKRQRIAVGTRSAHRNAR